MLVETQQGDGAVVSKDSGLGALMARVGEMGDEEILAMLAQILRAAKIPGRRAARILRISKTTYFEVLKVPFSFHEPANLEDADDVS